jgi:hypothetical protein
MHRDIKIYWFNFKLFGETLATFLANATTTNNDNVDETKI